MLKKMLSLILPTTLFLGLCPAAPAVPITDETVFVCNTSKLHYLPGEEIEYRALVNASLHPKLAPAKVLELELQNATGTVVLEATHQFGLQANFVLKEVFGELPLQEALAPGKYTLVTRMRDLHPDGMTYAWSHEFGVLDDTDPFVCETPHRFVKDFAFIQDAEGLFHVFAITGELVNEHAWNDTGQERCFAHMTSHDMRHWEIHPPVLSINGNTYADGPEKYQDQGVWAPHIIQHDGLYYMFYTSVNTHVSQSVSLATSPDLFNWAEHPNNPVFTLEDAAWADWTRTAWADCRDPMVIAHGDKWYMYVTARMKTAVDGVTGVVGMAESSDLINWTNPRMGPTGPQPESIFVWEAEGRYFMTASSGVTAVSNHPGEGWIKTSVPRTPLPGAEPYVQTSAGYADEVVTLPDGRKIMGCMTWRKWGNSIYFFEVESAANGMPEDYLSPFSLPPSDPAGVVTGLLYSQGKQCR